MFQALSNCRTVTGSCCPKRALLSFARNINSGFQLLRHFFLSGWTISSSDYADKICNYWKGEKPVQLSGKTFQMVTLGNESLNSSRLQPCLSPNTCIHLKYPGPLQKMEPSLNLWPHCVHIQMGWISTGIVQFCFYFLLIIKKLSLISRSPGRRVNTFSSLLS